ncbi:TetR/AcrR family transcriptional regulator [Streptomyces sp. NBC_00035]|uniref:TetR/AcrR family transcriptional regulator n=1 Tax=Streptomyces sp. NBC_00035 TaxID=2903614 RepID=UPI0032532595
MPKLWNETIAAHRTAVREATLDTTAALVAEHGLAAVTMSQIAEKTGIGRATLYKYFPDVESILVAWHERQVNAHLAQLSAVHNKAGDSGERLQAVLETYALMQHEHGLHELAGLLHRGAHVAHAEQHLTGFVKGLLEEGVTAGRLRDDVSPDEMASYCIHALGAARDLPGRDAVHRLVELTLAAIRPTG